MDPKPANLKPLGCLKRKSSSTVTNYELCIFCQDTNTHQIPRSGSNEAKHRVYECLQRRQKSREENDVVLLDRFERIDESLWKSEAHIFKWHKNCYSSFTSISNIQCAEKRYLKNFQNKCQSKDDMLQSTSGVSRRQSSSSVDWEKCMFCQNVEKNEKLHNVMTLEKSTKLLQLSKGDPIMNVRLSNVNDLVAAEGKYHQKCVIKFERKTKKCPVSEKADEAMFRLCRHLNDGLKLGHVFDMIKVWETYGEITTELGLEVPAKYLSRRHSFYEDVKRAIGAKAGFVRPLGGGNKSLLMYPGDESDFVISHSLSKDTSSDLMASSESESSAAEDSSGEDQDTFSNDGNAFQEMVHVALRIRADLDQTPGHDCSWRNIDQKHVQTIVPNSLYLFLVLLFGGMSAVDDLSDPDARTEDENTQRCVLSVAQDIVFGVSKGKKLTPKHVGLGLTLHQATRSESLIDLFHAANHCIPIQTVRKFDNAIANQILESYKRNGYVYIPPNIQPNVFTHFSCDNIDVLEDTLDGKNTFHCTQMMAWQRETGTPLATESAVSSDIFVPDKETMKIYHEIDTAKMPSVKRPTPVVESSKLDMKKWLEEDEQMPESKCSNLCWTLARKEKQQSQSVPLWGSFNESMCTVSHPLTNPCMLPILSAPADEFDTINTVIRRFMGISRAVGQAHTVITADQPLYSKAKELVWANPEEFSSVILMMGGLHVCFNFIHAIGQHMENSGLEDVWLEAGVFGPNTVNTVMEGKAYYRAVRGHLLTYEALWRLKWRYFEVWLSENHKDIPVLQQTICNLQTIFSGNHRTRDHIKAACTSLSESLHESKVIAHLEEFEQQMMKLKNYAFWSSYLRLIEILLCFIKAQRTGNWLMHVEAFAAMLPWMAVYDHLNYARWGPVYLADMKTLDLTAPEVHKECLDGNFVVKRSNSYFNEVPADQATEWMNKVCKTAGGIIGITRQDQARDRFCITWSRKSQVSGETQRLYGLNDDDDDTKSTRHDSQTSRVNIEEEKINNIAALFESLDVFGISAHEKQSDVPDEIDQLVSIASKDVATEDICNDLLTCESRGRQLVEKFTISRLKEKDTEFFAPLKRTKSKTFAILYKTISSDKQHASKQIKADRKLMQRLFNAASSGRTVQTADVLKHELSPVPLALAKTNGDMNPTAKSQILDLLTKDKGIETPQKIPESRKSTCVVIDGHALIQAKGKPHGCQTFGEYANEFVHSVFSHFKGTTSRVDVVFDRYYGSKSIKAATRKKRTGKRHPIRKQITSPEVPLPHVWEQYIVLDENKKDLADFLSAELLRQSDMLPEGSVVVAGGGFTGDINAKSNNFDADHLSVDHEEADTRMIIHAKDAIENGFQRLIVICRDTDVLLLMLYHIGNMVETWMVSGTAKQRRCYPVHTICDMVDEMVRQNILGFSCPYRV